MATQSDGSRFALGRLAECGPLLIANGRVYMATGLPRWREVTSLASLEDLDAASLAPEFGSHQRNWHGAVAADLTAMLPEHARPYAGNVLTFCTQAERYRTGRPFQTIDPIVRSGSVGPRLHEALGAGALMLICRGIVFVPRNRLAPPYTNLPAVEERLLPLFQPGGAITIDEAWRRYETGAPVRELSQAVCEELRQEVEAALEAMRRSCRSGRTQINMQVIYECDETSLAVLSRPPYPPVFTMSSEPWVVEDADGSLYRMDGFTLGVRPNPDAQDNLLAGIPAIIHPPAFQHWRHPGGVLHFCTHQQDWPVANILQVDNAVTLLLSAQHLVRAGLYGPPGSPPVLKGAFSQRRITREDAERRGLPVYPFHRGPAPSGARRIRTPAT